MVSNRHLKKEALELSDYLIVLSDFGEGIDVKLFNGSRLIKNLINKINEQESCIENLKMGNKSKSMKSIANTLMELNK